MKKLTLTLAGASVALTGIAATPAMAADFGRHDRNRYEQLQRNRVVVKNRYVQNQRFQARRWNPGDRFDRHYASNYRVISNPYRTGGGARADDRHDRRDSVAEDFRELGHEVAFTSDGQHWLDVQPNLLRRAVRNLVDNAVKYAGPAEMEVKADEQFVSIAVLDRGPGIPPAQLDRIASAFYRGEPSRNRETGGAGLGLSIAQAVADAHGGTLTFANREGGGLAAIIRLPIGGELSG